MSFLLDAARVAAAANVVMLLGLAYIWAGSYRELRSKQTLGALVFSLLLLAENALALYYYTGGLDISPPAVRAMMLLQVLEAGGIAFLLWVTAS